MSFYILINFENEMEIKIFIRIFTICWVFLLILLENFNIYTGTRLKSSLTLEETFNGKILRINTNYAFRFFSKIEFLLSATFEKSLFNDH